MKPVNGAIIAAIITIPVFILGSNYFYCVHFCHQNMKKQQYEAESLSHSLDNSIIYRMQSSVINLSLNKKIINVALGITEPNNPEVLSLLDSTKWILNADLAYVLDNKGTVVASTLTGRNKSLQGKNYSYRPYFKKAIKSQGVITYEAVGAITKERGIYFSHSIYDHKTASIAGVAVIKAGVAEIEKTLQKYKTPLIMVTEDGIVFISNKHEWLYKTIYNLPENKLQEILKSKQFGNIKIEKLPVKLHENSTILNNNKYNIISHDIENTDLRIMMFSTEPKIAISDYIKITALSLIASLFIIITTYSLLSHQKAQKKIRENLTFLHTLINTIPSPVYYKNTAGIFQGCNTAYERIFNIEKGSISGKRINDFADKIIQRIEMGKDNELIHRGGEQEYEVNISDSTHHGHEYLFRKALYKLEDGSSGGIVGVATNLDEIKKTQKELEESRKRFKAVVDNIGAGITILSPERNIQYLNRQMHDWFSDIIIEDKPTCSNVFNCYSKKNCKNCPVEKAVNSGEIVQDITELSIQGQVKNCRIMSTPIRNRQNDITSIVVLIDDLTNVQSMEEEKDKLKAQLNEAEKLRAVGQLAAGVAHEINNPLGFIKSNLETMKDYTEVLVGFIEKYEDCRQALIGNDSKKANAISTELDSAREEEDIDFIVDDLGNVVNESIDGVLRVHEIVKNLKSFARVDQPEDEGADINECIESALKIAWNELKYTCEVIKEYGELPETKCNTGKLNQVFLNLLINASHAIEDKGRIFIRTRSENDTIIIEIEDTGCGIPEDKLTQIFEPFFTTKEIGVGTGLGLSIVQNIIEEHKGNIEVNSKTGEGTVFRISLPVISKKD